MHVRYVVTGLLDNIKEPLEGGTPSVAPPTADAMHVDVIPTDVGTASEPMATAVTSHSARATPEGTSRVGRAFRQEILEAEANPDLYGLRRSVCIHFVPSSN